MTSCSPLIKEMESGNHELPKFPRPAPLVEVKDEGFKAGSHPNCEPSRNPKWKRNWTWDGIYTEYYASDPDLGLRIL